MPIRKLEGEAEASRQVSNFSTLALSNFRTSCLSPCGPFCEARLGTPTLGRRSLGVGGSPSALTARATFLADADVGAPRAIRLRSRPGSGGQDARAPLRAAIEGSVGTCLAVAFGVGGSRPHERGGAFLSFPLYPQCRFASWRARLRRAAKFPTLEL